MIIDNHVHLLLEEVSVEDYIEEFTRCGINMVLLSDLGNWNFFPSPEVVRAANERAIQYAEKSNGRIKALAYVCPVNDDWREALTRCLGQVIGVKLWTSLSNDAINFDATLEVLKLSAKLDLPVLIHSWNVTDDTRPGQINIKKFAEWAKAVPECKMIAAHTGANWRQSIGALKDLPNVWCDICGGYPAAGMVETLVEDIGADRILFGSDALGRSYTSQYAKALFADITPEQLEMISSGNIIKLYNLTDLPEEPQPDPLRPLDDLPDMTEDHFCFCGHWPFADLGCNTPAQLEQVLAENDISAGYAGSLDGMFMHNIIRANRQFIAACADLKRVKPLAVLNPVICNCPEAVKDAAASGTSGAILYPTLHNWQLDDDKHGWLFELCAELGLKLWINCGIDDPRFHYPSFSHRAVETNELLAFTASAPNNSYIFQGLTITSFDPVFKELSSDPRFKFELSRLTDGCFKLRRHLEKFGKNNLVTGSEYPFRDIRTVRYCARRV
jgi:uncharacterized protein